MGVSSEIIIRAADSKLKIREAGIVTRYDGIRDSSKARAPRTRRHQLDHSLDRAKTPNPLLRRSRAFLLVAGALLFLRALDVFNRTNNLITIYMLGWLFCVGVGLFWGARRTLAVVRPGHQRAGHKVSDP